MTHSIEGLVAVTANAIESCLETEPGEAVLIVFDAGSRDVARVIGEAAKRVGLEPVYGFLREEDRPLPRLPSYIGELFSTPRLAYSFYVAGVRPGELGFRSELIDRAISTGMGHVHMPRANLRVLSRLEGCRETARIIERLATYLRRAEKVTITSRKGTSVEAVVGEYKWKANTGIIERGEWDNWPPGEVFTTPSSVEGVLVVDGVLGDYLSTKYGLLRDPVVVEIEDSIITSISGGGAARELEALLDSHGECGRRIGELGVGGNPYIDKPIGIMLHDEKMPGAHLAAGDPLGSATGAKWKCSVHVDMLPLKTSVRAGSVTLIEDGVLRV